MDWCQIAQPLADTAYSIYFILFYIDFAMYIV